MSCTQCGVVEPFTNKQNADCQVQKTMSSCLWNAQGMLVCENNKDNNAVVPNKEMAQSVYVMKNQAQYAHPWES
jgi:hypothetical protein